MRKHPAVRIKKRVKGKPSEIPQTKPAEMQDLQISEVVSVPFRELHIVLMEQQCDACVMHLRRWCDKFLCAVKMYKHCIRQGFGQAQISVSLERDANISFGTFQNHQFAWEGCKT